MKSDERLSQAILNTIHYGDIFEYPMTEGEIFRYLIGVKSTQQAVHDTLLAYLCPKHCLIQCGPYYLLPGREKIVEIRIKRAQVAAVYWPRAMHYAGMITHLPFIRMVAVTGSLAMNNLDPEGDLDYLVVTQAGRLWTARGLVILLVRLAARLGDPVCPNYFLSERAITLPDQNIFSAHELVQMVPLHGKKIYDAMRQANSWTAEYLPNASGRPNSDDEAIEAEKRSRIQQASERLLLFQAGEWIERWEMQRKLRKFRPLAIDHAEAQFGPEYCKGHVDDHGKRILHSFTNRQRSLERLSV